MFGDKLGGDLVGGGVANAAAAVAAAAGGAGAAAEAEVADDSGWTADETAAAAAENAAADEVLVAQAPDGGRLLLEASLASGGGLTWAPVAEEAAAAKERRVVAASQMASMLHDADRNAAYAAALQAAVDGFKEANGGAAPVVLDVGTGTGLLAMLAAKAGAAHVYACEMFKPMAEVARRVVAANGFERVITVVAKRSTEVTVGEDGELPARADIIVSEVLDSALLGEGVLPMLRDAFARLLKPGAVAIPAKADLIATVVECAHVAAMHDVSRCGVYTGDAAGGAGGGDDEPAVLFVGGKSAASCLGGRVALPMHTTRLGDSVRPLTEPFTALTFDLSAAPTDCTPYNSVTTRATAVASGRADAVHVWWDLELVPGVTYSTRPGAANWQDHWLQVMFPLARMPRVEAGGAVDVVACHSDIQVWFDAAAAAASGDDGDDDGAAGGQAGGRRRGRMRISGDPQTCMCGLHTLYTSQRIWALNDRRRTAAFSTAVSAGVKAARAARPSDADATAPLFAMDVSDGSVCSIISGSLGDAALEVASLEEKRFAAVVGTDVVRAYKMGDVVSMWQCGLAEVDLEMLDDTPIELLMSECFYLQMQRLPLWRAVNFWLQKTAMEERGLLAAHARVLPARAVVKGVVVEFAELWRGHGKASAPEGFDHAALDEVAASWHDHTFSYPVWMFEHTRLTPEFTVLELDYAGSSATSMARGVSAPFTRDGTPHALLMWVDYVLTEGAGDVGAGASDSARGRAVVTPDGPVVVSEGPAEGNAPSPFNQSVKFLPQSSWLPVAGSTDDVGVRVTASLQVNTTAALDVSVSLTGVSDA